MTNSELYRQGYDSAKLHGRIVCPYAEDSREAKLFCDGAYDALAEIQTEMAQMA